MFSPPLVWTIIVALALQLSIETCRAARTFGTLSGTVFQSHEVGEGVLPDGVVEGGVVTVSLSYNPDAAVRGALFDSYAFYGRDLSLIVSIEIESQSNGVITWAGLGVHSSIDVEDNGGQEAPFYSSDRLALTLSSHEPDVAFFQFPNLLEKDTPTQKGADFIEIEFSVFQNVLDFGAPAMLDSTVLPREASDITLVNASSRLQIVTQRGESYYSIGVSLDPATFTLTTVPEPATGGILMAGIGAMLIRRRTATSLSSIVNFGAWAKRRVR